jgi:peptidoglycan/xylan/chitin deacetylase (PgdA/CDA1 family)
VYPEPPLSGELDVDLPAGARWALVLSHDVDHLGLREHLVDRFLIRYGASICRQELVHRFRPGRALDALCGIALAAAGRDRWDALPDLLEAERRAGVKSTWFLAVRRGLGISYGRAGIVRALAALRAAGADVGLHGQNHGDAEALATEARELSELREGPVLGLRMHYLRLTRETLDGMERAGLRYDSTVFERKLLHPDLHPLAGPRLVRRDVIEIPMHVMDSTLFSSTGMGFDLDAARDYIRRLTRHAAEVGRALVVNLHPSAYSRQSPDARAWYDTLLGELTGRSDVFVTDFAGLLPRVRT